jgi:hypothetical protein
MKLISLGMAKNFLEVADKIGIEAQNSSVFLAEEIITGGTSMASAKVLSIADDHLELVPLAGTLQAAEVITGGLSGATATTSYVTGRFDTMITTLIEQISALIEKELKRELKAQERTKYFDSGRSIYALDSYPIIIAEESPFTVTLNDEAVTKDDDYYLDEDLGVIEFWGGTGTRWPRAVKVVYTGGYTEGEDGVLAVPDYLKHACLMQVAFEFKRREDLGLSGVSMPGGSVSTYQPADLLPEVKGIIKNNRRQVAC